MYYKIIKFVCTLLHKMAEIATKQQNYYTFDRRKPLRKLTIFLITGFLTETLKFRITRCYGTTLMNNPYKLKIQSWD